MDKKCGFHFTTKDKCNAVAMFSITQLGSFIEPTLYCCADHLKEVQIAVFEQNFKDKFTKVKNHRK